MTTREPPLYATDDRLRRLLPQALQERDIADAIEARIAEIAAIEKHVLASAESIWSGAAHEITDAEAALRREAEARNAHLKRIQDAMEAAPVASRRLVLYGTLHTLTVSALCLVLFAALSTFAWSSFRAGSASAWETISDSVLETRWWIAIFPTLLLTATLLPILIARERRELESAYQQSVRTSAKKSADEETKHLDAESKVALADRAVVEAGLAREVRTFINGILRTQYGTTLPKLSASGLSDTFNSAHEIATGTCDEINRLLSFMPGGSLGLSGARGSGKTTLLQSMCVTKPPERNGRAAVALMVSAPVRYDARDFTLHIFAEFCKRILQVMNAEGVGSRPDHEWGFSSDEATHRRFRTRRGRYLQIAALQVALLGFVLAVTGTGSPSQSPASPSTRSAVRPNDAVTAGAPARTTQHDAAAPEANTGNERNTPGSVWDSVQFLTQLLSTLGVTPARMFWLGLLVYFAIPRIPDLARRFDKIAGTAAGRRPGNPDPDAATARLLNGGPLIEGARQWLDKIRFQRSYTSGWSGALKLPIGIEGGANASTSFSQQQLSLPEIVQGFRELVTLMTTDRQVVIGIDELDKIASSQQAADLLNDSKVLFGVKDSFFIVSVSEDALAVFDSRATPFRDAFDSAFDSIVAVAPLTFDEAIALLRRRVIGLPIRFAALCYALSLGLPRDLIRYCRSLLLAAEFKNLHDFSELARTLVTHDASARIRALAHIFERKDNVLLSQFAQRIIILEDKLGQGGWEDDCPAVLLGMRKEIEEKSGAFGVVGPELCIRLQDLASQIGYIGAISRHIERSSEEQWRDGSAQRQLGMLLDRRRRRISDSADTSTLGRGRVDHADCADNRLRATSHQLPGAP